MKHDVTRFNVGISKPLVEAMDAEILKRNDGKKTHRSLKWSRPKFLAWLISRFFNGETVIARHIDSWHEAEGNVIWWDPSHQHAPWIGQPDLDRPPRNLWWSPLPGKRDVIFTKTDGEEEP